MWNEADLIKTSSENPPATKRHKGRHKREVLRITQKGKGPRGKHEYHAGRQASGEGGIRTRGGVTPTQHFQCCTFGRSVTSPKIIKACFSWTYVIALL